MAAAYKAQGTIAGGTSGANGTLTVPLPASFAAGDFALLWGWLDEETGTNTIATGNPTGWTEIMTGVDSGSGFFRAWYRFLQGGDTDPAIDLFGSGSTSATEAFAGACITYTGVDTSTPLDGVTPVTNSGGGTPVTTAGVTTATNNAVVVTLAGRGDNEAFSGQTYNGSSTGVNERFDSGVTDGNDAQLCAWDMTKATAGASGTSSATTSAADPWIAVTFSLRAAPETVIVANARTRVMAQAVARGSSW